MAGDEVSIFPLRVVALCVEKRWQPRHHNARSFLRAERQPSGARRSNRLTLMNSNEILNDLIARQQKERFCADTMAAIDCALFFQREMEAYKLCIERAHSELDKSELIGDREHTRQGLTPRIKSIVAKSNVKAEI